MARPKGIPKTGGRAKGVPNKITPALAAEIAASGLTPLDYMLKILRDTNAPEARRDDMAKAAAPYVHPKLASTVATVKGTLTLAELVTASICSGNDDPP